MPYIKTSSVLNALRKAKCIKNERVLFRFYCDDTHYAFYRCPRIHQFLLTSKKGFIKYLYDELNNPNKYYIPTIIKNSNKTIEDMADKVFGVTEKLVNKCEYIPQLER